MRENERGVALLIVSVTLAFIATIIVSIRMQTNTLTHIAIHSKNRLQAEYLAKLSIKLATILIVEQKKIDQQLDVIRKKLKMPLSFKLWELLKFDSDTINILKEGGDEALEMFGLGGIAMPDIRGFNDLPGRFWFKIDIEDSKLNLNDIARGFTDSKGKHQFITTSLGKLLAGEPFKSMIERGDSKGNFYRPEDLLSSLRDWVDDDDQTHEVHQEGKGNLVMKQRGGNEDSRYGMLSKPYKNKNNVMYSYKELHFIQGFTDKIIKQLKKKVTIYKTTGISIKDANIETVVEILKSSTLRPEEIDELIKNKDPNFLECLLVFKKNKSSMDQKKFLEHFKKCGVKFTNERTLKKILADGKPTFYKIMGYGQMDDLEVKIETAITFDKKGKLIIAYWNEIL